MTASAPRADLEVKPQPEAEPLPETVAQRSIDLRLVPAALLVWAAVAWGLTASTVSVVTATLCGCLGAIGCLLIGRRWRGLYGVGLAFAITSVVLGPLALRLDDARGSALASLARARSEVTLTATVTADPRMLRARGPVGAARVAVEVSADEVLFRGHQRAVHGAVLLLAPADRWNRLLPGQRVRVLVRMSPPLGGDLFTAAASARSEPELLGEPPWWQRAAGSVRTGIHRAASGLPTQARGLLPGLVVGDTSDLDPVLADNFRRAGLTHLVAVSGSNCSIAVGTVTLLLVRLRASPRTVAIVGGLALLSFVIIARPSASVLRAAAMTSIALAALATGRQRAALPGLAAATILLLLYRPTLAVDLGFALSVAATVALLLLAPPWAEALHRRRVPRGLAEALAIAAAAHVVTAPIVASISGQVSLTAIPANLLAEPVVAAATVLGLLAALTSPLCLPVARLFAELAGWPCRWLVLVANRFGPMTGGSVPWLSGVLGGVLLAVLTLVAVLACRRRLPRVLLAVALTVAVVVQIPGRIVVSGWPPARALMVACDIGQGDAAVVPLSANRAIVIDAGPDPVAVNRCLHALQITEIPLLVLSHFHLDHVGGLLGVIEGRRVGSVVTSPLPDPKNGDLEVRRRLSERGIAESVAASGQHWSFGDGAAAVTVEVLGPRHPYSGTRSDPNNSSVVLRVISGGYRILLPGDAEVDAQDDLLQAHVDVGADILKVPHHGSAYSDPAFLAAVHPSVAVVSVGAHNDYGHPSPQLLQALARDGVPAYRTDLLGDIAIVTRGAGLATLTRKDRT